MNKYILSKTISTNPKWWSEGNVPFWHFVGGDMILGCPLPLWWQLCCKLRSWHSSRLKQEQCEVFLLSINCTKLSNIAKLLSDTFLLDILWVGALHATVHQSRGSLWHGWPLLWFWYLVSDHTHRSWQHNKLYINIKDFSLCTVLNYSKMWKRCL